MDLFIVIKFRQPEKFSKSLSSSIDLIFSLKPLTRYSRRQHRNLFLNFPSSYLISEGKRGITIFSTRFPFNLV
ncbi:hypothetical protein L1887_21491 [Cichorium endivia]|nr:hypothetical protein L1887_21491 [Cichorium endivia]